jgi:hypothetical protein
MTTPPKSPQATRDGVSRSASRFTRVGPTCLSWMVGGIAEPIAVGAVGCAVRGASRRGGGYVKLSMRTTFGFILFDMCLAGCATRSPTVGLSEHQADALTESANELACLSHPGRSLPISEDFPYAIWHAQVRALHPVAVYCHQANIVIALRRDAHEEQGYYVVPVCSSFMPFEDDPEWSWKQLSKDSHFLYAYTRKR